MLHHSAALLRPEQLFHRPPPGETLPPPAESGGQTSPLGTPTDDLASPHLYRVKVKEEKRGEDVMRETGAEEEEEDCP